MKLQKWLDKNERSQRWLARRVDASVQSVSRWCEAGAIAPKEKFMEKIEEITGGQVTKADFKPSKK